MRDWLRSQLRSLERALKIKSSVAVGGIFWVPLGIIVVVFFILDSFFAKFFKGFLEHTPLNSYFSFAGFSTIFLVFLLYFSGLAGTRHWFMQTFGRIIVFVPFLGASYKRALHFHYMKKGFLRPVLVFRNGSLRLDRNDKDGIVLDYILGNQRRGFYLREVTNANPDVPEVFRTMCEVVLPPSQVVGGEPEFFPFPLVCVQVEPDVASFSKAIITQGLEGYEHMRTISWDEARTKDVFKELPEKDRRILERLSIILPTASPLSNNTNADNA